MSVQCRDEGPNESLAERYRTAVSWLDSKPQEAFDLLSELQPVIAGKGFFSFSHTGSSTTESIDDISTSLLSFLVLEHYLAHACVNLPTGGMEEIEVRQRHLQRACDLWSAFLQKLDALEQLEHHEKAQFEDLLQLSDSAADVSMPPPESRDSKIARFRAKMAAEQQRTRLESLAARRSRLGMAAEEEMDGHDEDGLERSLALTILQISKGDALDEWSSVCRELPMIAMMVKAQQERQGQYRYHQDEDQPSPQSQGPLKVTHVTQDTAGKLLFRREEVRANTFRPGWNQPTMSLEELGRREVNAALEREARQKESESHQKTQPRRYDQLLKDGLEDDAELVDASAALDRRWDAFKDENPRGSGNKRGDVGDRNF